MTHTQAVLPDDAMAAKRKKTFSPPYDAVLFVAVFVLS
jgi:hypothetical protein